MSRVLLTLAVCALGARAAGAQAAMPGTAAKAAAHRAADATSEHVANEQRTGEVTKTPAKTPAKATAAAPTAKPAGAPVDPTKKKQATGLNVATPNDTSAPPTMIMRETYEYARDGRRDPYLTLMASSELRPTLSDLKLTSIMFDPNARHSVAVLRDISTNKMYAIATGATLGRMRVVAIRTNVIVFSIDEFGTNRQDSLVLGDPTKTRLK